MRAITPTEWNTIIERVLSSNSADWNGYDCVNAVQSLRRLTLFVDRFEVQINAIRHAEQPHCHGCWMTSLILVQGYGYWLQQYEAKRPAWMFAAPGSLITMGPTDSHWIPKQGEGSLSLCVFDKQTDWHEHYPALESEVVSQLHQAAVTALRTLPFLPRIEDSER